MILPGNVIGYIDFGITGIISKYSRQNLLAMTLAYARKDVDGLCDRFFDVSSLDHASDPLGFREGVKRLSEHWYSSGAGDAHLQTTTTQVMLDMLKLSKAVSASNLTVISRSRVSTNPTGVPSGSSESARYTSGALR